MFAKIIFQDVKNLRITKIREKKIAKIIEEKRMEKDRLQQKGSGSR